MLSTRLPHLLQTIRLKLKEDYCHITDVEVIPTDTVTAGFAGLGAYGLFLVLSLDATTTISGRMKALENFFPLVEQEIKNECLGDLLQYVVLVMHTIPGPPNFLRRYDMLYTGGKGWFYCREKRSYNGDDFTVFSIEEEDVHYLMEKLNALRKEA